jgi:hypothetical protein
MMIPPARGAAPPTGGAAIIESAGAGRGAANMIRATDAAV